MPQPSGSGWVGSRIATGWPSTSTSSSRRAPSPSTGARQPSPQEAALDGLYVIRTSVGPDALDARGVVLAYKRLAGVERDFRALKTSDLEVRPVHHWREDRVRAHLFLCLLAAYVRWHLERAWAPLLFRDEAPPERLDAVAPPERSAASPRQGPPPPHARRASRPQLPLPARRAGHAHPQPGRARRQRRARGVRARSPRRPRSRRAPWPSRARCLSPRSQSQTIRSSRSVLDHALRGAGSSA